MRISIFAILLILFVRAKSDHVSDTFINCLNNRSDPNSPITGTLYTPDNSSFSSVFNAYIRNPRFINSTDKRKPSLIFAPSHFSQIQSAVVCAKSQGLQIRARSGGHDYEGLSFLSFEYEIPFFILDMFNLRSVDVDVGQETVWVQTGATLGEVYYSIAEKSNIHGLPGGVCPTVAIAGHCSGAGYGNMMRKYGLTVDNIVDAQFVDVNGAFLDRQSMGEDLFWAITGGGGSSFGIVIAYNFKMVRVPPQVTYFNVKRMSEEKITDIAYKWLQIGDKVDDDLFIRMSFDVVHNPEGTKTVRASFSSLFLGNATRLLNLMNQNFTELGLQKSDCMEMRWIESTVAYAGFAIGTATEALLSRTPQPERNRPSKIKSDYLHTPISKSGLKSIFDKMKELENQMISFNPLGGRMKEISEFAKPYPHRAGNIAKIEYETYWDDPGLEASNRYIGFTRMMHEHMAQFVSKNPRQSFFNYRDLDLGMNSNGKDSYIQGMVYGIRYFKKINFDRLVKIKTMVDPLNFFRNEQGIPTLPSSNQ